MKDKPTLHHPRINAPVTFRLVDIGKSLACRMSIAVAINSKRQALLVGTGDYLSSYFWEADEIIEIKPPRPNLNCWAGGLNEQGIVVGSIGPRQDQLTAYFWKNGKMTLLPTLAGGCTYATGITNDGIIYGVSHARNNDAQAVCWKNGKITAIDIKAKHSLIMKVSNDGPYVGRVADTKTARSFIYYNRKLEYLPAEGLGLAINIRGSTVGSYSSLGDRDTEPFLYENKRLKRLPSLGGSQASAYGLNNQGWIVGRSITSKPEWHGFLWCHNRLYDLNHLLKSPGSAIVKMGAFIDNSNIVTGSAIIDNKEVACLLLPEK